jgi:hypothetical protein
MTQSPRNSVAYFGSATAGSLRHVVGAAWRSLGRRGARAAIACGAIGGVALADAPYRGPGVLFSPFYYTNPGESAPRVDSSAEQVESMSGLLGPLSYTNNDANDVQRGFRAATRAELAAMATSQTASLGQFPSAEAAAAAIEPEGDLYWIDPGTGEAVIAVPGGAVAFADRPAPRGLDQPEFRRLQGEEVLPAPAEPGAIPIPAEVAPVNPPPTAGAGSSLAEAESLGDEPDAPRLQFLRTQSVLLEPGEMQFDVGLTYALVENDFPVVRTTGAGSQVLEATFKQRQVVVPLELRLGVTPRMQVFVNAPVGWANTEFAATGVAETHQNDGGLGDMNIGSSFLLFDGQGNGTDVVFTFAATLPTGDSPFLGTTVGALSAPTLGDNLWAVSGDLLWIDNYDPLVVFYGVGYRHQFDREFLGVDVNPGEEARLQLGVGFAVNKNVTLSTRFAAAFVSRTKFDGDAFDGSFNEPMTIRFAATILDDCRLVEPFAEIGASDDAASSRFGVVWTY